jgi:hypothetical protein
MPWLVVETYPQRQNKRGCFKSCCCCWWWWFVKYGAVLLCFYFILASNFALQQGQEVFLFSKVWKPSLIFAQPPIARETLCLQHWLSVKCSHWFAHNHGPVSLLFSWVFFSMLGFCLLSWREMHRFLWNVGTYLYTTTGCHNLRDKNFIVTAIRN